MCSWTADATANIAANPLLLSDPGVRRRKVEIVETHEEARPHTKQCCLSPATSTWGQVSIVGIDRSAVHIAVGFQVHYELRLCSPGIVDTTLVPQCLDKRRTSVRLPNPADARRVSDDSRADHAMVLFG